MSADGRQATHGYRVLLVAQRSVTDQTTVQDDRALTLLGYLTFLDLPKPDAADTIATCTMPASP